MQKNPSTVVILGTGGTIAGTSVDPADQVGYRAGQIGVAQLLSAVPGLAAWPIESEQVAQIDSKDMDASVWRALAARVAHHLARADVCAVVVTHGTDTMEETAYLLQRVLAPGKPVVLTGAMRPATALAPDGPQNLQDAVNAARQLSAAGGGGVCVSFAGEVHDALRVRKVHPYRLDAFSSGEAGPLAVIEESVLRLLGAWPKPPKALCALAQLEGFAGPWPRVEILASHAGADGAIVPALQALGVQGLIVAGTGNGTVNRPLELALQRAAASGITVWRCTRCAEGAVVGAPEGALPSAGGLTPVQARIELMLSLMAGAAP
jgi:L-asparaginase